MKKWVQKTIVVMVALLTFGAISPNHEIWTTLQDKGQPKHTEDPTRISEYAIGLDNTVYAEEEEIASEQIEDSFVTAAKEISYLKFGTKIGPVIGDEFDEVIFPKIEEAIQLTLAQSGDLHKRKLAISERPAGDYSEKIFNVYDLDTRKDLIRFHVRTEKRPQDGYFFNFHYHVAGDGFLTHHSIGDIYWSKNTPPKWLS